MKKIMLILLLIINSYGNSMFKATFVNEDVKKESATIDSNSILSEPKYVAYSSTKESTERILSAQTSCIDGGCPLNAQLCKEDILYDKGISKEHNSFLTTKQIDKKCPEGFNKSGGECKKFYTYYTYSCLNDWNGVLESTGGDCEGKDLVDGACNSKIPPEKNCFKENYTCPFEGGVCSKMKSETKPQSMQVDIYKMNSNKLEKKEIVTNKVDKCEGSVEKNGKCVKTYYINQYSCQDGYELTKEAEDCLGFCGENGCVCNPAKIENACKKTYDKSTSFSNLELYEYKDIEKEIIKGDSIGDSSSFYGFSSVHNEIEFIHRIYAEDNLLCFESDVAKGCFEFKNCSFEGEIDGKIKNITVDNKSITSNNSIITSTCDIFGHVGNDNITTGITGIEIKDDSLVFYDSFLEKELGTLTFRNPIDKEYVSDIIPNFYSTEFKNGYTYFFSNKECKGNFEKVSDKELLSFKNKPSKCAVKKKGNFTIENITKVKKKTESKGYDVYKCSPISCENNYCQTASCQNGYNGNIHSMGEYIEEFECRDNICDAKKPYSLYCGIEGECNESLPDVIKIKGECKQASCESGTFDKNLRQCVTTTKKEE